MQGQAALASFGTYTRSLLRTIVFPWQWKRLLDTAKQHKEMDPRADKKMAAAIGIGVLLFAGGVLATVGFQADATVGIYQTMDGRMADALGESNYQALLKQAQAEQGNIDLADRKMGEGEDPEVWQPKKDEAQIKRNEHIAAANALQGNHNLYLRVSDALAAQDDELAQDRIAADSAADRDAINQGRIDQAFERKDIAVSDMERMLWLFVYPGLIGLLWAPAIFSAGTSLKASFVPSETVGFKPYPAGAASLLLLVGCFGIPALFFSAFVMQDFEERTELGQIAL